MSEAELFMLMCMRTQTENLFRVSYICMVTMTVLCDQQLNPFGTVCHITFHVSLWNLFKLTAPTQKLTCSSLFSCPFPLWRIPAPLIHSWHLPLYTFIHLLVCLHMSCVNTVASPTVPTLQPMLPSSTIAWTAPGNAAVPAFAAGKCRGILLKCNISQPYLVHLCCWLMTEKAWCLFRA